jgi:uncharacterized protein YbjT (DUF2867 family)
MTTLVVGATGVIGSRVVTDLAERGQQVRALVRTERRASGLPSGVDFVVADLDDARAVDGALEGVNQVVLIAANSPSQVTQEGNVIRSAKGHDVKHLVKLSVGGASPEAPLALARDHFAAEQLLEETGVPSSIVRPAFFMQNLLQYAPWISRTGEWTLPLGDLPIAMIDAEDVAAVVAAVVVGEPRLEDAVVTGSSAITMAEAAAALSAYAGRTITYVDGKPDDYKDRMISDGADERYAEDLTVLYDQIVRAGYAGSVTTDLPSILGRDARSFDEFAAANADVFRG